MQDCFAIGCQLVSIGSVLQQFLEAQFISMQRSLCKTHMTHLCYVLWFLLIYINVNFTEVTYLFENQLNPI